MNTKYLNKIVENYKEKNPNDHSDYHTLSYLALSEFFKGINLINAVISVQAAEKYLHKKDNICALHISDEDFFDDFDLWSSDRAHGIFLVRDLPIGLIPHNVEQLQIYYKFMADNLEKVEKGLGEKYKRDLTYYYIGGYDSKIKSLQNSIETLQKEQNKQMEFLKECFPNISYGEEKSKKSLKKSFR